VKQFFGKFKHSIDIPPASQGVPFFKLMTDQIARLEVFDFSENSDQWERVQASACQFD
jgi:hypothetical protein